MQPTYNYSGIVNKVIDGDTIDATVDLGFSVFAKIRFRLYGIDTPEKTDKILEVKNLAIVASKFVSDNLTGKSVVIQSVEKDKYGRWLAKVYVGKDQPTINEQLISLGYAKAYFGDSKKNLGWDTI